MKKTIKLITVLLGSIVINAQNTQGTLTFTFTTPKHTSGNYVSDGRYVLAAWIETSTGTFVKTKIRNVGPSTDDHLPVWGTAAGCANPTAVTATTGCNTTDATTGATLTTFTAKTFTWDGKNTSGTANGTVVPDGTYRVALQETWGHGSSTTTRYFTFTKGTAKDSQTPASDTNFTNISLVWTPANLAVEDISKKSVALYPNPATTNFVVDSKDEIKSVKILDEQGKVVKTYNKSEKYDISELGFGVYFVEILTNKESITQKLIKK